MGTRSGGEETPPLTVYEVFVSVQGEGLFVGQPQVFIRFSGCNLDCRYCDEPASRSWRRHAPVAGPTGETISTIESPATVDEVIRAVEELENEFGSPEVVSLTGGEPLLQHPDSLRALATVLRETGYEVLLETNASIPEKAGLASHVADAVSADVKLPGHGPHPDDVTERCIRFVGKITGPRVYAKIVITDAEDLKEARSVLEDVVKAGAEPVYLQPATGFDSVPPIEEMVKVATETEGDVRVLPQVHAVAGWK